MVFSVIDLCISYCFTHRRKSFPICHAIDVFSLLFLCSCLALALSTPHMTNHSTCDTTDCHFSSCSPFYQIYQPIPHAFACNVLICYHYVISLNLIFILFCST